MELGPILRTWSWTGVAVIAKKLWEDRIGLVVGREVEMTGVPGQMEWACGIDPMKSQ